MRDRRPPGEPEIMRRRQPARASGVSEKQFMQQVIRLARLQHWIVYHVYDARRSTEGFPDGWFVREGVLLVREFKTETGRVTPAQQWWLTALAVCGIDAKVWKPSDWPEIQEVLA